MDGKPQQITCNERNYGIDLLRITAMMFIPILHILGHGGILSNSITFSAHYGMAWLMEIIAYCAVNCYALISGFVGYGSKYKYSNLIYICIQVSFYTLMITGIFKVLMPETVGFTDILKAVFPIPFGVYWYVTAYFCMFFFIPYMNYFLDKAPKVLVGKLLFTIIVLFSILPTIFCKDIFKIDGGYSPLWLSMLYLVGAYIKKYDINKLISIKRSLIIYFVCIIVTWGSRYFFDYITNIFLGTKHGGILVSYYSPTILCVSILLLLIFSQLKFRNIWKKIISFFAPVSLGVYLIHEEPLIRAKFITNNFVGYLELNPFVMALAVLATALAIWFICSMIDRLRLEIFKVLKIKQLSEKIECGFRLILGKVQHIIEK